MSHNKIKSYAKINLALNVIKKSYSMHKIETLVAFIDLYDEIYIKKIHSKKNIISFLGEPAKNIPKKNTVTKLFNILDKRKLLKNQKFEIKIIKKIPIQAGLGGGSMNAASILRYFVKKEIIKTSKDELEKISKLIGSDVILGLDLKYTILNQKNSIKRFSKYKKIHVLIVKPNFGCSTKLIYSKVKNFVKPKFDSPNKRLFDLDSLAKMQNSLEQIAFSNYPKLKILKILIEKFTKPVFVRMTGSGSALVAYYKSKKICENAKKKFNKRYRNYWCIASKTI